MNETNINLHSESTKLDRLQRLVELLDTVKYQIAEEQRMLTLPSYCTIWLFHTRDEVEGRLRFKRAVYARLFNYYKRRVKELYTGVELFPAINYSLN